MGTDVTEETVEKIPTPDDVVAGLWEHVWLLVRTGQVDAALTLVRSSVPDFLKAVEHAQKVQEAAQEAQEATAAIPLPRARAPLAITAS